MSQWQTVKLGDATTLITSGSRGWAKYYANDGAQFIRMTNLSRSSIQMSYKNMKYVRLEAGSAEGTRTRLKTGDILISITAELGKIGYVDSLSGESYINQHIALIRVNNSYAHPKFLAYLLSTKHSVYFLNQRNDSGSKAGLNLESIHNFRVRLPSLDTQERAMVILETCDKYLEATESQIDYKTELRQGLIDNLLTGKGLLKNGSKATVTKYFACPSEWPVVPIAKIASQKTVKNRQNSALPVLSCTKHAGLVDSLKYFKKQIFSKDLSTYKIVRKNQFVYATNHIEEGSIGLQNLYDAALVSPMYTVFEVNDRILTSYLYPLLKTELFRHIFESSTSSSVNRRGSLRWKEFSRIKIPLPPMSEQRRISDILANIDNQILLLSERKDAIAAQRKYMLEKLVTGKIPLPESLESEETT